MTTTDRLVASLDVMVNYGQIIVHLPSIGRAGHVWGDAEIEQGFAWSPGIVSFGMPEHSENCRVDVLVTASVALSPDAVSALSVPFTVTASPVLVGSVFYFDEVAMAPDDYTLVAEVLPWQGPDNPESEDDPDYVVRLHFTPREDDTAAILRVGGAIKSDRVLSQISALA